MPSAKTMVIGIGVGVAVSGAALAYNSLAYPESRYKLVSKGTAISSQRVTVAASEMAIKPNMENALLHDKQSGIDIYWAKGQRLSQGILPNC